MKTVHHTASALRIRLLGPLMIERSGTPVVLARSRKVRALIAYLALAPRPPSRAHLCELLWDLPNDPRSELRWSLSRVRAALDEEGHTRVLADADTVHVDVTGMHVDALQIRDVIQGDVSALDVDRLRALALLFTEKSDGEFLSGLEIERSASYSAWLLAQRRYFRASRIAILEHLVRAIEPASAEAHACIGQWLQLAPYDCKGHEALFKALACRGQLREGDEHLAATSRSFEAEGQNWAPIGRAWHEAKTRHAASAVVVAVPQTEETDLRLAGAGNLGSRRASLAVMPFADRSRGTTLRGGLADGLAYDIITRLAKLRSMFVIAPGTMFALEQKQVGAQEAGRTLGVDYVVSGVLRRHDGRLSVTVQLIETRTARIIWTDEFAGSVGDAFAVLQQIGDRIVSSVANQVEQTERNLAMLKVPDSLDAWEAHHRGLWHMYRFDRENNDQARRFFDMAIALEPGFSRPYAGLSFTHFQNAFLGWSERDREIELAYRSASQGLMADDQDPAAHWALGRAHWLRGQMAESLAELDVSVALSPNFAVAHYTLAFVHSQSGDPSFAIRESDLSRELSPYDPLLFGMLGSRAMALSRLGRHDEAAVWALKAMARPNAHVHILGIGAYVLALAGQVDEARAVSGKILHRVPGYRLVHLLKAFRYADETAAQILSVAKTVGLD